jgi:hypothetical protein
MQLTFPDALIGKRFFVTNINFNLSFSPVSFYRHKEYQPKLLYLNSINISFYRNLNTPVKIFNLTSSTEYIVNFKFVSGRIYFISSQLNFNLSYLVLFLHFDLSSTPITFSRYKNYSFYNFNLSSTTRLLYHHYVSASLHTFNVFYPEITFGFGIVANSGQFNLSSNLTFYRTKLLLTDTEIFQLSSTGYLLFNRRLTTNVYNFGLLANQILFHLSYRINQYTFHLLSSAFLLQKKKFVALVRFFSLSFPEIEFRRNYHIKINATSFSLFSHTSLDINQAKKLDLFLIYPPVTLLTTKLFGIQKYLFTLQSSTTFGRFKKYQSYNFTLSGPGINCLLSLMGGVSTTTFLVNSQVRLLRNSLIRPFYTFVLSSNLNLLITKAVKAQYTFVLSSNILLNRQIIYNVSYTSLTLSSVINFKYSRVEPLLYYGFSLSSSVNASVGKSVHIILNFNITSSAILEFNRIFNISSSKNFYLQSQADFKLKIKEILQTYNFSLQSVVNLRKGKSLITAPYHYYFYSQPYLIRSVIGHLSWFAFTINSEASFKLSLIENLISKQFLLVSSPAYLRREKRLEVQPYQFNISSNVYTTARHIFRIKDQQLFLTITSIRTLPIPPELTCWFLPQPPRFISFYEIYGVYVPLLRYYFSDASYRIFRESTKDYIYPDNLRIELWPGEVTLVEGNVPAIYVHRSELKEQKPGIGTKLSKTAVSEFDKHTNLLHIQGAARIFIYNYEYYATVVLAAEIQKYLQYIRRIISKRLGFAVLMAPEIINISPVHQVASDNIFVATIEQKVILTLSFKTV